MDNQGQVRPTWTWVRTLVEVHTHTTVHQHFVPGIIVQGVPLTTANHPPTETHPPTAAPPQFAGPPPTAAPRQFAGPPPTATPRQFAGSPPPTNAGAPPFAGQPPLMGPPPLAGPPQSTGPPSFADPPPLADPPQATGPPQFAGHPTIAGGPLFAYHEPFAGPPAFAAPPPGVELNGEYLATLAYFIDLWSGKSFEFIPTNTMLKPKFWDYFASLYSPEVREYIVNQTVQRALEGGPDMDPEPFPLEERIVKDLDMDFRAVYDGIAMGRKLQFLKDWFSGKWEPMFIVMQEPRVARGDSETQDLTGQEVNGSDRNYDPFAVDQSAWEWTADDSEAEREGFGRQR